MQFAHQTILQLTLREHTYLITASHQQLAIYNAQSFLLEHTNSTSHTALIRLLACYTLDGTTYLVSTGEDKQLVVCQLPELVQISKRELVKRANDLKITQDGEIVVGDKFGDVYSYPLLFSEATAPVSTDAKSDLEKKKPLLGHVSMLNVLALLPPSFSASNRALIVTGDRDEHIRISHFPKGHIISKFLWGSKHFISSLLPLSASSTPLHTPLLLSGGGDPTLQLFDISTGALLSQFEIQSFLLPYVIVKPINPRVLPSALAFPGKSKRRTKQGNKDKEEEEEVQEGEGEGEVQEGVGGNKAWQDELDFGIAVVSLVQVMGDDGQMQGVIVVAAGCTALLYIPLALLLPSPSATSPALLPTLLDLHHPILSLSTGSSPITPLQEFWVSLDITRSSPTPTSSSVDTPSLMLQKLVFKEGRLSVCEAGALEENVAKGGWVIDAAAPASLTNPNNTDVLYPVLALLHRPDSDFINEAAHETNHGKGDKGSQKGGNNNKKKLKLDEDGAEAEEEGKKGRRRETEGKRRKGREQTERLAKEAEERARKMREEKEVEVEKVEGAEVAME